MIPEVEFRMARFLGVPLSVVRDAGAALQRPDYPGAQLRQVKDIGRDRVGPAIHLAMRVAEATLRSWRGGPPALDLPPQDPLAWRALLQQEGQVVRLRNLLPDLWRRGIPVIHLDKDAVPEPRFQGMACIVAGRPAVVLAHNLDEPGHLAFVIAHEVGHIAYGDCVEGQPVVDEDDRNPDDAEVERRADLYSARVLLGEGVPELTRGTHQELAEQASRIEKERVIDAALVIRRWGRLAGRAGDEGAHALAARAVAALGRDKRGKVEIRRAFDQHVDLEAASDADRALLSCLHGDPEQDAAPS
ncbi:MAG: ImmA/IrrE family metallo-endopeptidase [Pseudomonadota bacterium]|nr:ImmA/IrrE family metallo-endopeptidase [Pseudomonadota bacterium]